jgi:hypothetical protein
MPKRTYLTTVQATVQRTPAVLLASLLFIALTSATGITQVASSPPAGQPPAASDSKKTVWDGVFSDAQAVRGQALYSRWCTTCHRDDLTGSDGPPLRGLDFFIRWREQTIGAMLGEVGETMPESDPGSLKPQEYLDILGFLFKANGVPVGTVDLTVDSDAVQRTMITEKPKN